MAYEIKVKDVAGNIHTVETEHDHSDKTVDRLLAIAASILGIAASALYLHSHGKK